MNILEITNLIRTTEDALAFLRPRGVLRVLDRPPICPVLVKKCNSSSVKVVVMEKYGGVNEELKEQNTKDNCQFVRVLFWRKAAFRLGNL